MIPMSVTKQGVFRRWVQLMVRAGFDAAAAAGGCSPSLGFGHLEFDPLNKIEQVHGAIRSGTQIKKSAFPDL